MIGEITAKKKKQQLPLANSMRAENLVTRLCYAGVTLLFLCIALTAALSDKHNGKYIRENERKWDEIDTLGNKKYCLGLLYYDEDLALFTQKCAMFYKLYNAVCYIRFVFENFHLIRIDCSLLRIWFRCYSIFYEKMTEYFFIEYSVEILDYIM